MTPSDKAFPFTMKRRQFPIRVAYAMTINKAQGQSFKRVGIYLPKPVFSHGQLYVALSRSGVASQTKVFVSNQNGVQGAFADRDGIFTKNIVYNEVL